MEKDIVVSIICNTYNHEKYISEALDSFLMQKTNFKFEVLVHDDASTDGTADIIREYEKKYPDVIKPIYQKENQYSKGIDIGFLYQIPRVKGKYIALCEGDDYWIDEYKLQKQVDAMEKHPEIDMCAHEGMRVNADTKKELDRINPASKNTVFKLEQVIMGGGEFVVTNSLLYRADLNKNISKFRKHYSLDYSLQIHGSVKGGMLYLADNMAVYRWGVEGSWTFGQKSNFARRRRHFEKTVGMLKLLDLETEYKYTKTIASRILSESRWFYNDLVTNYRERII